MKQYLTQYLNQDNIKFALSTVLKIAIIAILIFMFLDWRASKREISKLNQNIAWSSSRDSLFQEKTKDGDTLYKNYALLVDNMRDLKSENNLLYNEIRGIKGDVKSVNRILGGIKFDSIVVDNKLAKINDTTNTLKWDYQTPYLQLGGNSSFYVVQTHDSLNPLRIHPGKTTIDSLRYNAELIVGTKINKEGLTEIWVKPKSHGLYISKIDGAILEKTKKKSNWGLGVHAGIGVGGNSFKPTPQIGLGIQYTIIKL